MKKTLRRLLCAGVCAGLLAAPALALSRATTAAIITRLAATGLLAFRYSAPAFRLVCPEPEDADDRLK